MQKAENYPTKQQRALFAAILKLKNLNEAARFFRDLLTIKEIEEFTKRWQIAQQLHQGQAYARVAKTVEVSTTTVTRVAHWLKHGLGGYQLILNRLFPKKIADC